LSTNEIDDFECEIDTNEILTYLSISIFNDRLDTPILKGLESVINEFLKNIPSLVADRRFVDSNNSSYVNSSNKNLESGNSKTNKGDSKIKVTQSRVNSSNKNLESGNSKTNKKDFQIKVTQSPSKNSMEEESDLQNTLGKSVINTKSSINGNFKVKPKVNLSVPKEINPEIVKGTSKNLATVNSKSPSEGASKNLVKSESQGSFSKSPSVDASKNLVKSGNRSFLSMNSNEGTTFLNLMKVASLNSNSNCKPENDNINMNINDQFLEEVYSKIGHKDYCKVIMIFEKYCGFGKNKVNNLTMDFSQFNNYMLINHLYNTKSLNAKKVEGFFNKIKGSKKSKLIQIKSL